MAHQILVAESQPVARAGLQVFLARTSCQIVAEVANCQELEESLKYNKVDLVLLSLLFEEEGGLVSLRRLRESQVTLPVLVWAHTENLTDAARSRAMGACGILLRDADRETTLETIEQAASGKSVWTKQQLKQVDPREKPTSSSIPLTQREFDVASQLAHGLPDQEIAWALGISVDTVKKHIRRILSKLGLQVRSEAAVLILRRGWA